jgi:Protein of unknown function (DUF2497)
MRCRTSRRAADVARKDAGRSLAAAKSRRVIGNLILNGGRVDYGRLRRRCSMGQAVDIQKPSLEQRRQLNAVHCAWDALAQSVLVENVRTLQDLAQEMLRPMLKSWLDDNLPAMVERLVRAEIERVTGSKSQESEKRDMLFR